MPRSRALPVALTALAAVGGLAVASTRWSWSSPSLWLDVAVGWSFLAAGLVIALRPGGGRPGALVGLVAVAWFAADVVPGIPLLHRAVLVHAALAMPRGLLRSRARRFVAGAAYVVCLVPVLAGSPLAAIVLATAVIGVSAAPVRRGEAGLLVGGVIGVTAVAQLVVPASSEGTVLVVAELTLIAVAVALAMLQASSSMRDDVTDLVIELGPSDALAVLAVEQPEVRDDPAYRDAVTSAERLLAVNAALTDDLERRIVAVDQSRRRLLSVHDAERRDLERRLQHGPVGRLDRIAAALAVTTSDDPRAAELLAQARSQLVESRGDLARLAHGLYPAAVADGSLESGLHAIAAGSPLPVRLDLGLSRVEPELATLVYFLCAEGVTNAVRHSGATEVSITVERHDAGQCRVVVEDDGAGGALVSAGTGLRGLADRVALAGGTLVVDSPVGGGTRLEAMLPLRATSPA